MERSLFLGIDPSCNGTGLVLWDGQRVGPVMHIRPDREHRAGVPRLRLVYDTAWAFTQQRDRIVGAAIEGYSLGSENRAFRLGEVGGVLRVVCSLAEVPLTEVAPAWVKQFATGKGQATKEQVHAHVRELTGYDPANHDLADALALALIAEALHLGHSPRGRRPEEEVVHRLLHREKRGRPRRDLPDF